MALWGRLARPGDPAARHGQYLDLRGGLDRDALTAAIQCAIAETPALALRIADPGDGPRQATGLLPMPGFADLSAQPHPVGQALAQMRADLARPLDLAQEPAGALSLFVISPARHLLFLRADALALDACGMACLTHRIALHYARLAVVAPDSPGGRPDPDPDPAPHRLLPTGIAHAVLRLATAAGVPWANVLTALSAAFVLRLGGEGTPLGLPHRPALGTRGGPPPPAAETVLPYRPRLDPDIPLGDWLRAQSALIDGLQGAHDHPADPPAGPGRVVIDVQPFARAPRFPGLGTVGLHVLAAAPAGDLRLVLRGTPRGGLRLEPACDLAASLPAAGLQALLAQGLPAFLAAAVAAPSLGRIPMACLARLSGQRPAPGTGTGMAASSAEAGADCCARPSGDGQG